MRAASPISKRALTNSSRRRTWREPFARKLRRSPSISGPENERPMGSPPCSIPGLGAAPDWPSRNERRGCPRLRMSIGLAMKPSQPPSKACCWASAIVEAVKTTIKHLAGAGILAETAGQLESAHTGQLDIDQQEVGDHSPQYHERLLGVARHTHRVAFAAQRGGSELQADRSVVHHDDGFARHETREYSVCGKEATRRHTNGRFPCKFHDAIPKVDGERRLPSIE